MKKKLLYLSLIAVCLLGACSADKKEIDAIENTKITSDRMKEIDGDKNSGKESSFGNEKNDSMDRKSEIEASKRDVSEQVIKESEDDNKTQTTDFESDLNRELADLEIKSKEFETKLQDDITQMELNQTSYDWYILWDNELNSLWARISNTVDADTKDKILAEQRNWIKNKEIEVEEAGKLYDGGSIQALIKNKKAAKLTRARCYVLATYLGETIGQIVEPMKIDYSGRYVDTQGTMESYSDLYISEDTDGTYAIEIGIYRVTTLEGTAILENGVFKFTDLNDGIKGDIIVDDESATFIVTESTWDLIKSGELYNFPEKW